MSPERVCWRCHGTYRLTRCPKFGKPECPTCAAEHKCRTIESWKP